MRLLPITMSLCALAGLAVAQQQPGDQPAPSERRQEIRRPAATERVVRLFDFEEAGLTPVPVPEGWVRGQNDPITGRVRPGFPVWNGAELIAGNGAARGRGAVRLPTQGGSASLLLKPGVIAVLPGADYAVAARVRTEGLEHAVAIVAARLLDEAAEPIEGATWFSEPIADMPDWHDVRVTVLTDAPGAAFLQVELLLLQPREAAALLGTPRTGDDELTVWQQDVSGGVWFDDVAILQRPRLRISAESPTGVFLAPRRPAIDLVMRDLTGERLTVGVRLIDHEGNEIDRVEGPPQVGVARLRWVPRIDRLGWYRADAVVRAGDRIVARASLPIAHLPDLPEAPGNVPAPLARPEADRARLEVLLTEAPPEVLSQIADLLRVSGSGAVTLPLWDASPPPDHAARAMELEPAIDELLDGWSTLTLAIPRVSTSAMMRAERDATALARDPVRAERLTEPYLDRFGQRVQSWMLGLAGADGESLIPTPRVDASAARALLDELVPSPVLRVPESYQSVLLGHGHASVVAVPRAMGADELGQLARAWAGAVEPDAATTFALSVPQRGLPADGLIQLARQGVALWHDLSEIDTPGNWSLGIIQPWSSQSGPRGGVRPAPALAAWRLLADRLVDRRGVGLDPITPGVRSMLFVPGPDARAGRDAMLVAWADGTGELPATIELPLGGGSGAGSGGSPDDRGLRFTGVLGNPLEAELIEASEGRAAVHRVRVGRSPVFIEGVDAELLQMLASIRLAPALVESRPGEHEHELVIKNPWSVPLRGRAFILEPGGLSDINQQQVRRDRSWDITPRLAPFSAMPGETVRVPLSLAFASGEESGQRELVVDIDAQGGLIEGLVRRSATFELGLPEATLDAAISLRAFDERANADRPLDAVITAEVTNRSGVTLAADVVLISPGFPRQKATIPELAPGETVIRRFVIPVAQTDRGGNVRVSLTLIDDGARLTRTLEIP
ncbi:MAG: hypothetical protein AAF356_06110 [Planctomycetota bacterium]